MTESEEIKWHAIIHSHAVAGGNFIVTYLFWSFWSAQVLCW